MKLNELIGTKYPLIQGGMANIATAEFAAAVSNAGALGLDAEKIREQIRICRSLTDKPFGVNIMMMNPHVDEIAQVMVEEKVPVVTTGAGNPGKYIPAWKEAGIKVLPVTATVALARRLARRAALQADGRFWRRLRLGRLAYRSGLVCWLLRNARSTRTINRRWSRPAIPIRW